MMKQTILLALFITLPILSFAQESNLGNWIIYFGNKQLNKEWNWHHEVQYRNYNAIGDLEQLLLRTGVGRNLSPGNNNLLLGYGYILSQNYVDGMVEEKISIEEHRIYQQFITKQSFGRIKFQHRYRFEQRFVEDDFRLRFRYFLALNVAINQPTVTDKTVYFSAYNELFINNNRDFFDRNRLYGGLGYRFNKNIRIEIGYMNQFLNAGNRDQLNLITFASF